MRGTKKLTMFSRKLSFLKGSKLDLRAPDLLQTFDKLEPGADGKDGNHGVNGTIGKKMALRAARNLCSYNECHAEVSVPRTLWQLDELENFTTELNYNKTQLRKVTFVPVTITNLDKDVDDSFIINLFLVF